MQGVYTVCFMSPPGHCDTGAKLASEISSLQSPKSPNLHLLSPGTYIYIWEFLGVPYFGGPSNKDPTI